MSGPNLVMVDFAAQDTRSVQAMLRGYDDGRTAEYERFIAEEALREPILTLDELNNVYSLQRRAEFQREYRNLQKKVSNTWLARTIRGFVTRHHTA